MFSTNKNKRGALDQPAVTDRTPTAAEAPRPVVPSGVTSIISSDMTVRGNLKSPGSLRVEGTVVGDIEVDHLVVADGAVIQGEIKASVAEISGALTGLIRAHEITLKSTARVIGDVFYEVLAMEPKAEFEGHCRKSAPEIQSALPAPESTLQIAKDTPEVSLHSTPANEPGATFGSGS